MAAPDDQDWVVRNIRPQVRGQEARPVPLLQNIGHPSGGTCNGNSARR